MSSYTTQISTLIEQATQYDEGLSTKERIEIGRQNLFSDIDYPLFDGRYKRTFETHFIRHFYTREIGFETEGLFKFKLETWLQINMPYFNKLFESELLEYDPLSNIDIHSDQDRTRESDGSNTTSSTQDTTGSNTTESNTVESRTQDTTGSSTTESDTTENSEAESNATSNTESDSTQNTIAETESNQDNLRIHSDNPDSRLALTTSGGVIEYASELTENKTNDSGLTDSNTTSQTDSTTTSHDSTSADATSSTESTTTSQDNTSADASSNTITTGNTTQGVIGSITGENTGNEQEQVTQLRKGKDGTVTYQQMVKELRQTFIRIEQDIFDEMNKELFMLVY